MIGHFDGISQDRVATGWVCLEGRPTSISVQIYLDGSWNRGATRGIGHIYANNSSESAVNDACKAGGKNYRFSTTISSEFSGRRIYVHGTKNDGTIEWDALPGSGVLVP